MNRSLMTEKEHFYWLDTFRAVAALLVMLCHARCVVFGYYSELAPESQGLLAQLFFFICTQGVTSVAIFFLLSGFLVGGKTVERIQSGNINSRQYALDRLFRIGVPLFGAIILIVITNLIVGEANEPLQLLGQFTGLQGVLVKDAGGVFWTLAYEIWFYILLFGIILFVSTKRYMVGSALLVVSMGIFAMLHTEWLFVIATGLVAYFLRNHKFSQRSFVTMFSMSLVFFVLHFCSHSSLSERFAFLEEKYSPFYLVAFVGSFAIGLSQIIYCKPQGMFVKLINKWGGVFAKFSYSLYLTHYQVLKIHIAYGTEYHELTIHTMGYFITLCGACLLLAYLFYFLVERNTKRIQSSVCELLHL